MGNNSFNGNADALLAELTFLLQSKKKIQAIKLYREVTGVGLSQAKEVVDRIEMAMVAGNLTSDMLPFAANSSFGAAQPAYGDAGQVTMFEIEQLVAQRRKIEAIKLYRQMTGAGLREAKEQIDRLESSMRWQGF